MYQRPGGKHTSDLATTAIPHDNTKDWSWDVTGGKAVHYQLSLPDSQEINELRLLTIIIMNNLEILHWSLCHSSMEI